MATPPRAGAYLRLSKDDGGGESASIASQRSIVARYAGEHGIMLVAEYVDDGWSGTGFERPGFLRMLRDIEAGVIDTVLTKDLSRLGRDYIRTGEYTEIFFPRHGIRCVAIDDGYDSERPQSDIAPFKNVINELYARDLSRKIRSSLAAGMREGKYIGNFAPYGYRKDPADRHHLLPDAAAAAVVRSIFAMAAAGETPAEIAASLNRRGIPSPAVYRCIRHPHLRVEHYTVRGEWTAGGVRKLLRNEVYRGHLCQGKAAKPSLKSPHAVSRAQADWIIVRDTHEPLVSQDVFDAAQLRGAHRGTRRHTGFVNLLAEVARCADCGGRMSSVGTRKQGSPANLACAAYKLHGRGACSNHFIDYNVLYGLVLQAVREQARLTPDEQADLVRQLRAGDGAGNSRPASAQAGLQARLRVIDRLVAQLYEDRLSGILSAERLHKLLALYEQESGELQTRLKALQAGPAAQADGGGPVPGPLRPYLEIGELTPGLVRQLIDRVEVEQGCYVGAGKQRHKQQAVRVYLRFACQRRTITCVEQAHPKRPHAHG